MRNEGHKSIYFLAIFYPRPTTIGSKFMVDTLAEIFPAKILFKMRFLAFQDVPKILLKISNFKLINQIPNPKS